MKKILCITNSYPIHPRLRKIGSLFKEYDVHYFTWNRDNRENTNVESNVTVYCSRNGYGTALKMVLGVPGFIKAVRQCLKKESVEIIIIRHWSTCFVLLPFISRKYRVIYDVSDMPDSENERMIWIYKVMERYVLNKSKAIILSSSYYIPFYRKYKQKIFVLENKVDKVINRNIKEVTNREQISIAFIGMIRYYDSLINLVKAVKGLPLNLHFYGKGIDNERLIDYCQKNNCANVHIHGAYDYKDIPHLYKSADLIYSAYPAENENVRYSIPNKLYESLAFNKPLIASKSTALGDLIELNNIGFTVDNASVESIRQVLERILQDSCLILDKEKGIEEFKKENDIYWNSYLPLAEKILNIVG